MTTGFVVREAPFLVRLEKMACDGMHSEHPLLSPDESAHPLCRPGTCSAAASAAGLPQLLERPKSRGQSVARLVAELLHRVCRFLVYAELVLGGLQLSLKVGDHALVLQAVSGDASLGRCGVG